MVADVIVGFKGLRENFTSRVVKSRPHEISVDYVDGPLKYLRNHWIFTEERAGGCSVTFAVDFAFKSKMFELIAGQVFERALKKMTDAFVARAETLYGSEPGMSNSSATSAA
jgi:coenzyme Q-binding protein COQ10